MVQADDPGEDVGIPCPFCSERLPRNDGPDMPLHRVGQAFRDHLRDAHPVQHHDLATTRWHGGAFVRCDPPPDRPLPRILPRRRTPPPGHGVAHAIPLDERPVEVGALGVTCLCGFTDVSTHGIALGVACLEWHWARIHRLRCPHCDVRSESDRLEAVERELARHIGLTHPERFPWGYGSDTQLLLSW